MKIENTLLATAAGPEVLTATGDSPCTLVRVDGRDLPFRRILVRP